MQKFNFNNLKIGDTIITTNNEEGVIVALKSIAYLNDKLLRKSDNIASELSPFVFDNNRHKGVWYAAITVAILDKTLSKPTYYLEGLDFIEVKEIVKKYNEQSLSFLEKIKKLFK